MRLESKNGREWERSVEGGRNDWYGGQGQAIFSSLSLCASFFHKPLRTWPYVRGLFLPTLYTLWLAVLLSKKQLRSSLISCCLHNNHQNIAPVTLNLFPMQPILWATRLNLQLFVSEAAQSETIDCFSMYVWNSLFQHPWEGSEYQDCTQQGLGLMLNSWIFIICNARLKIVIREQLFYSSWTLDKMKSWQLKISRQLAAQL